MLTTTMLLSAIKILDYVEIKYLNEVITSEWISMY